MEVLVENGMGGWELETPEFAEVLEHRIIRPALDLADD